VCHADKPRVSARSAAPGRKQLSGDRASAEPRLPTHCASASARRASRRHRRAGAKCGPRSYPRVNILETQVEPAQPEAALPARGRGHSRSRSVPGRVFDRLPPRRRGLRHVTGAGRHFPQPPGGERTDGPLLRPAARCATSGGNCGSLSHFSDSGLSAVARRVRIRA
jgi:hypothetical protein